ncbi:MAG TPA: alpha-ketoacid dehydrogenase subunit beta [Mycobacteriales bacterium]|jgi:pyruvate dehydrogenase E1 component beta subunit|nr:alpha-ketoacid dehydrogenase subunit beta [Mycobacteriales bacterium]
MATITLGKALNEGLRKAMESDPKVVIMGEDVGRLGGVFRVTDQLQKDFGEDRVIDTPLAESGIVGTAIGMSIRGFRPICEIQFDGFVFPAFDQIVSQVAKMHYRSAGNVKLPITIRIPYGGGIGAVEHHSESPESYFAHTPGLKVVTCSNPLDAYTMIQHAVASDDPIVFFEPKRRYWDKADLDLANLDLGDPADLWDARVVREGTAATLITYGPSVRTCLEAAAAAADEGREIEVVDLRALSPIDWPTVIDSVTKTQHAIVVSEAPVFGSLAGEIAARVSEKCFYSLEAPVLRVGGWSTPYPTARVEEDFLPDLDRILDAVDRSLAY